MADRIRTPTRTIPYCLTGILTNPYLLNPYHIYLCLSSQGKLPLQPACCAALLQCHCSLQHNCMLHASQREPWHFTCLFKQPILTHLQSIFVSTLAVSPFSCHFLPALSARTSLVKKKLRSLRNLSPIPFDITGARGYVARALCIFNSFNPQFIWRMRHAGLKRHSSLSAGEFLYRYLCAQHPPDSPHPRNHQKAQRRHG